MIEGHLAVEIKKTWQLSCFVLLVKVKKKINKRKTDFAMSGNRKGNGNRQRNVSMTSNTSTSSFKDNSTLNQQRISQQQQLDLGSVTQLSNVSESHRRQRSTQSNNASSNREEPRNQQPNRAGPWTNSSPRPSSLFDSINFDFSEDRWEPRWMYSNL